MGNFLGKRTSRSSFSDVIVSESEPVQGAQQVERENARPVEDEAQPVEGIPVHQGVATTANLPAVPVPGQQLTLNISAESEALSATEQHKVIAMLSLKAPLAPAAVARPPLDLVIAADRSGSMHGEKIQLMRQTLDLLVKRSGLGAQDRVSLVSFDSQVKLEIPLQSMDAVGRAKAVAAVNTLRPGSTTNLSGGALKAIDVLDESANTPFGTKTDKMEKRTRAVMLFTDGLANEGIRDTAALCTAVGGALRAASNKLNGPVSLFTFGFGSDHNEDCLRRLANESGTAGQYYYVRTAEDIPNAFADCLGGLTSVVAQNATLLLEGVGGTSVARVLGSAYTYSAGTITLGDLFAEDEKDVLIELALPALSAPATQPKTILKASLRAFNIAIGAPDVVEVTLEIARPAATPANQRPNAEIDAQRNRLETASAMEQASALADRGDLAGGRALLRTQCAQVMESASAEQDLSSQLISEIKELEQNFRSAEQYRSVGSKMSRMQARSHQIQRSNHMSTASYAAGASRKKAMKGMWGLSSAASSDSD